MRNNKIILVFLTIGLIFLVSCSNSNENNVINNNVNDKSEIKSSMEEDKKVDYINNIKDNAINGMVINCDFKVKENIMTNVRNLWGEEDKIDEVVAAKGNYSTYSSKDIVFGWNKGEEIFEIRSYLKDNKVLNLRDIKNVLGNPDYDVVTNINERIVGYKLNDNFKLEFVLNNGNSKEQNQFVDHYSVFYPKGTINNMAGDSGREW
ncbi:MAG: YjgB family protein [Clostridium sp.]